MPTAKDATDSAKTGLGWTAATNPAYNIWRRKMRSYFEDNGIVYMRGASMPAWQAAVIYARKKTIGFPASRITLLQSKNEQAEEDLNYLLLDWFKKGREQARKAGMTMAGIVTPAGPAKRRLGGGEAGAEGDDEDNQGHEADDESDENYSNKRPRLSKSVVIRVHIVDTAEAALHLPGTNPRRYVWATCSRTALITLKEATIEGVCTAIRGRIPQRRSIRAKYSAITKPHRNGDTPADVERLHTDEDLRAFFQVAKTYAPTCLQVELARQAQSEPPDNCPFFPKDVFGNPEPAAQYDPPVSDSENDRYIRACGKAKRKMWPKSDKGFEHQKAMTRKRI